MDSPGLRCASVGGPGANGGATVVGGGKGGCMDEMGYQHGSLMQQEQQQQQSSGANRPTSMVSTAFCACVSGSAPFLSTERQGLRETLPQPDREGSNLFFHSFPSRKLM